MGNRGKQRTTLMRSGVDVTAEAPPDPETPVEDIDYIGQGFINAYWADLDANPYWVTGYFPTI